MIQYIVTSDNKNLGDISIAASTPREAAEQYLHRFGKRARFGLVYVDYDFVVSTFAVSNTHTLTHIDTYWEIV